MCGVSGVYYWAAEESQSESGSDVTSVATGWFSCKAGRLARETQAHADQNLGGNADGKGRLRCTVRVFFITSRRGADKPSGSGGKSAGQLAPQRLHHESELHREIRREGSRRVLQHAPRPAGRSADLRTDHRALGELQLSLVRG